MSRVLRKLGIMQVRKVSSQISLCRPNRLIRDDTFRLNWIFAKERLPLNENIIQSESIVPDKPVRTAQANMGRHFTYMHYAQFSQNATHVITHLPHKFPLTAHSAAPLAVIFGPAGIVNAHSGNVVGLAARVLVLARLRGDRGAGDWGQGHARGRNCWCDK